MAFRVRGNGGGNNSGFFLPPSKPITKCQDNDETRPTNKPVNHPDFSPNKVNPYKLERLVYDNDTREWKIVPIDDK